MLLATPRAKLPVKYAFLLFLCRLHRWQDLEYFWTTLSLSCGYSLFPISSGVLTLIVQAPVASDSGISAVGIERGTNQPGEKGDVGAPVMSIIPENAKETRGVEESK